MHCFICLKWENLQDRGLTMRCECDKWRIVIKHSALILARVTTIRCTPTLLRNLWMTLSFQSFFTALLIFKHLLSFFCYPKLNEIYHLNHILFVAIYAFKLYISGLNRWVGIRFYQPNFKGYVSRQEKTFALLLVTLIWLRLLAWLRLLNDSQDSRPGKLRKLGCSDGLWAHIDCCLFYTSYHR